MNLKDKVAIVTGAGVGIGVEYSKRLAAEGAREVMLKPQPRRSLPQVAMP